jgi:NADH:ubiquinone oxidoreductase subunit 5 (subunit L)/multisubunit Na+/H+ antiporter MnhA subunit
LEPLYAQFPAVGTFIAVIGTITCFLGASIALTQMDLKKGLAYSTVSQLGYMMLAMGCGAPVAGMFHLVTHAFFKAMLFLGSGSVIHAMEDCGGSRTCPRPRHATDGWTSQKDADYGHHFFDRLCGHQWHPTPGRLLEQG